MVNKYHSILSWALERSGSLGTARLIVPGILGLALVFLYYLGDGFFVGPLEGIAFFQGQAYHELVLLSFSCVVIGTALFWRIRWGVIFTIAGFVLVLPHALILPAYPDPLYRIISWLVINVLLATVVGGALNTRAQQLSYLREIINAQEKERNRLSRELHDDAAQELIDAAHSIDSLIESSSGLPGNVVNELHALREEVDYILEVTRRAVQGLQPPLIGEVGVKPALLWLCDEFTEETGAEVRANIDIADTDLSEEAKIAVYRISQEALTNIRKHAEATRVTLDLSRAGNRINLTISDNGKGFSGWERGKLRAEGRAGLLGIQQRAAVAHGKFHLTSSPGKGTELSVELPAVDAPRLN